MPNEFLNTHTHDAGWFHRDWQYSTDQSVDLANQKFAAVAHDGVSADELLEFVRSGVDFGQLTDREARQLSAALRQRYHQMSPEAKQIAEKFDATLQARVADLHDCSDDRLSGIKHTGSWFSPDFNYSDPDAAVLQGDELNAFVADLESLARPRFQQMVAIKIDPSFLANVINLVPLRG